MMDLQTWTAMPTVFDIEAHAGSLTGPMYAREALSRGLRFHRSAGWSTETTTLLNSLEPFLHMRDHDGDEEGLIELAETPSLEWWKAPTSTTTGLARVLLSGGRIYVQAAAPEANDAEAFIATLRQLFPPAVPDPEKPRIPVTFWSLGEMGPAGRTRMIDVPSWEDISGHYPDETRDAAAPLMGDFVPGAGGQLLLWHGAPGTGKTYALRALAWEWREWCDIHYIADPERFFGDRAAYMMDVLLSSGDDQPVEARRPGEPEPTPHPLAEGGRWRLLVLEDSGELMSADARTRSGQGLGRLLNVVDGLIGQGLRILVLVTTNEPLPKLHDAIARPGRCACNLQFPALSRDEAHEWLLSQGHQSLPAGSTFTIAELFAIRDGVTLDTPTPVGFAT